MILSIVVGPASSRVTAGGPESQSRRPRFRTDGMRAAALARARRPHDSPLADSTVVEHCDRYGVTVATWRTCRRTRLASVAMGLANPFSQPVVSCPALETGVWEPRFLQSSRAPLAASRSSQLGSAPHTNAPRRTTLVTYSDRTLSCVDCGVEFIHSAADQEYYQQKGFVSDPKRCTSCRASRRATRDTGYDVRDIGGARGHPRGGGRPPHRRAAWLRARRRPPEPRVFRRPLLVLWQPGAGAVQAAHGPAGLLLG